jgi:serine/threonine-protein kinase
LAFLFVLLLLAGGAVAYLLTRPTKVVVPPVVGEQLSVARPVLQSRGFVVTVIYQTSTEASQTVIGQAPGGGASVAKGSTVQLTVSSGPGNATVPPVVGETQAQAEKDIRAAGLVVGRVIQQPSNQYPAGQVTATDPGAGQTPPAGTHVALFVSTGPAKVQVPDVTGETEAQAKSDLHGAGFQVKVTTQTTNDQTQVGNVISVSPPGGSQLAPGSTVTIVVGQAATTATVPHVRGDTAADATKALQAAGFQVQQTTQAVTDRTKNGIVLHEMPTAGSTAKKGSTVTIVVGQYTAPTTTTTTTSTSTTTSTPTTTTTTTPVP